VQAIVKLALKTPFELGVVQIARMQVEVVSVHRHGWILKLNDQFDAIAFSASGEVEQGVLVETELSEDALQACMAAFGHRCIVKAIEKTFGSRLSPGAPS